MPRTLRSRIKVINIFLREIVIDVRFPGDVAGETLFKSKCAACHGPDGKGEVPMGKKLGARNLGSAEVQSQSDTHAWKCPNALSESKLTFVVLPTELRLGLAQ